MAFCARWAIAGVVDRSGGCTGSERVNAFDFRVVMLTGKVPRVKSD